MSNDDPEASDPPVVTTVAPAATGRRALVKTAPPLEPEMLVEALRHLQQNIPEFIQLSVQEWRSHTRAATLDPEFIENGLHAADVWRDTKIVVNRSGGDLRQEQEEIDRWDKVIVELRAVTDGIEAANLKRKHRLGSAILQIYSILGITLRRIRPEDAYMRPYYENMKRAYRRTLGSRKRTKKEAEQTAPSKD